MRKPEGLRILDNAGPVGKMYFHSTWIIFVVFGLVATIMYGNRGNTNMKTTFLEEITIEEVATGQTYTMSDSDEEQFKEAFSNEPIEELDEKSASFTNYTVIMTSKNYTWYISKDRMQFFIKDEGYSVSPDDEEWAVLKTILANYNIYT